jgi:hypothetical protein
MNKFCRTQTPKVKMAKTLPQGLKLACRVSHASAEISSGALSSITFSPSPWVVFFSVLGDELAHLLSGLVCLVNFACNYASN